MHTIESPGKDNLNIKTEANKILDFLASTPQLGVASAVSSVVRQIMLDTSGQLMAQGRLWDIKSKSLGAGIYQLSLKEK